MKRFLVVLSLVICCSVNSFAQDINLLLQKVKQKIALVND
jgi:hypothetical protein